MYDINLTRQALPSEKYRILLGTAVCVFNSNNNFVIEIIRRADNSKSWHKLIDKTSGEIKIIAKQNIRSDEIVNLFYEIIDMRNRIADSFQITNAKDEQILATKEKEGIQFEITESYLKDFIHKNEILSSMLHKYRGY